MFKRRQLKPAAVEPQSLMQDRTLVMLLTIFLGAAIWSALSIILDKELWLTPGFKVYDLDVEQFSFPIAIAKAGLALSGIYALAFRSQQTAIQIRRAEEALEETKINNAYANYRAHKEEMFKEFDRIAGKFGMRVQQKNELYQKLFHQNGPLHFSAVGSAYDELRPHLLSWLIDSYNILDDQLPNAMPNSDVEVNRIRQLLINVLHRIFEQLEIEKQGEREEYESRHISAMEIKQDFLRVIYMADAFLKEFSALTLLGDKLPEMRFPVESNSRYELVRDLGIIGIPD